MEELLTFYGEAPPPLHRLGSNLNGIIEGA